MPLRGKSHPALKHGLSVVRWVRLQSKLNIITYGHRLVTTGHPVRCVILKHHIGRLVVKWVAISEYLMLYVFAFAIWYFAI